MAPRVHLVTYATPRFRLRQNLLGWSARLNHVADTVTSWSPKKLRAAGFEARVTHIRLEERGSGFWAWKPFIIETKLREVPDGDLVFYCDVGRGYPFKQLTMTVEPFLEWMEANRQEMLPGMRIPWKGPMSMWTKRDALVFSGMDTVDTHAAIPVQASFSLWRAGTASRELVIEWLNLASRRELISDDPGICGLPELPNFHDHRHDQSLLTLCCLKHGIKGLDIGETMPPIDTKHPSEVARWISGGVPSRLPLAGRMLRRLARPFEAVEAGMRRKISFGKPLPDSHPPR